MTFIYEIIHFEKSTFIYTNYCLYIYYYYYINYCLKNPELQKLLVNAPFC